MMDDSVPSEPIEPFNDESESFKEETTPTFDSLRPPKKPLNKQKLKLFFQEIEPIIQGIKFLTHREREQLGMWLQDIDDELKNSKLSRNIRDNFGDFKDQYEAFLAYPEPFNHQSLLDKLVILEKSFIK